MLDYDVKGFIIWTMIELRVWLKVMDMCSERLLMSIILYFAFEAKIKPTVCSNFVETSISQVKKTVFGKIAYDTYQTLGTVMPKKLIDPVKQ